MTRNKAFLIVATLLFAFTVADNAWSQMPRRRRTATSGEDAEKMRVERRAKAMIDSAVELLEQKQEERAVKILRQAPQLFPESANRFRAYVVLGKHFMEKRSYDEAIQQFNQVAQNAPEDNRAEALFQSGICYFRMNDYDQAFMALRRVTNEFRWSDYANEAFYYIGMCHFKQERWTKADEALQMVGTSVPPSEFQEELLAEAGQRLFVKVEDQDLPVMRKLNRKTEVDIIGAAGDRERIAIEPLGNNKNDFIGAIPTAAGSPQPGDGTLQIKGGDTVNVEYVDANTEAGELNKKRLATILMVSTAAAGFTDGAFKEYVNGVFGDQRAFVRVKDLDHDITPQQDQLTVKIVSRYKAKQEEDVSKKGFELEEKDEWEQRDSISLRLVESEAHSGIFTGSFFPTVVSQETAAATPVNTPSDVPKLQVNNKDTVELEYTDDLHIHGREPRQLKASAQVVIGQLANVESVIYRTNDVNIQAKKLLIEAKIFLKWAEIFKKVGLFEHAADKSDEGIKRIDTVIQLSTKASLDRALVEDGFRIKWELLMVQDRLADAIAVCHQLTRIFPDSSLADRAFLQIAKARLESGNINQAIPLFQAVLRLPNASPDVKAEAQYNIGTAEEELAVKAARERSNTVKPNMTRAIAAYKATAEAFPDSHFAGESLKKIVNYYILYQDYPRAVELIERIMMDYPDKSWLHEMLLKWGVAAYRMQDYRLANEKFKQILQQYPGSDSAAQAKRFLEAVQRRLPAE